MRNITKELIDYLNLPRELRDGTVVESLVNGVLMIGAKQDSDVLLTQFVNNSVEFDHYYLLRVFAKFGDSTYAEKIAELSIKNGKLKEDFQPEILELLGHLQYEPIKSVLANYAFDDSKGDYHLSKYAVLGLLNFDCKEYQQEIREGISKCYCRNLFPEFIPALVCKLMERADFLEPLFDLGENYASTDCNAGILLGFSLCGEEGRKYFKRAINSANWEAGDFGTGTGHVAYKAFKKLKISFEELYGDIKNLKDEKQLEHSLGILFALLEKRVFDYDGDQLESFRELYETLYGWESENEANNLHDLASSVGMDAEAYIYERYFDLKLTEEVLLRGSNSQ